MQRLGFLLGQTKIALGLSSSISATILTTPLTYNKAQ